MAELRPCPFGPHSHRLKRAAIKCARQHKKRPWTKQELGVK